MDLVRIAPMMRARHFQNVFLRGVLGPMPREDDAEMPNENYGISCRLLAGGILDRIR
jgi:hypothetical protein